MEWITYAEKCKACENSFKDHRIEALKETYIKAQQTCYEAHIAYLTALDSYHRVYRQIWRELK